MIANNSNPEEPGEGLEGILNTERYVLREKIGRGCWGEVYRAWDRKHKREVAIKVPNPDETAQRQIRQGRSPANESIVKEGGLDSCANVVTGYAEEDRGGTNFLAMPYYEKGDLARKLDEKGDRLYIGYGLTFEQALQYVRDLANAANEMHLIKGRAHGDIKPSNMFLDKSQRLILGDLGAATRLSNGLGIGGRGYEDTRAPECFNPKQKPTARSDNYAVASFAYRLFIGEYPLERGQMSSADHNKAIDKKLKKAKIPRPLKKWIRKNLDYFPINRCADGAVLKSELEQAIESLDIWKKTKRFAARALGYAILPATAASLFLYLGATYEPQKLTLPQPIPSQGPFQIPEIPIINFDYQSIPNLPQPEVELTNQQINLAKHSTDNRAVAYLVKTHAQAQEHLGEITLHSYTDAQLKAFIRHRESYNYPGVPWSVWAKSIEVAFSQSQKGNKTDLKDTCAIARLGTGKVLEAKRLANSNNYKDYRNHIPPQEREFIDTWLGYIQADLE